MRKEPLGFYIFRILIGFGLLVFLIMLYWSSIAKEETLIDIRNEMELMKGELQEVKRGIKSGAFSFKGDGKSALRGRPHIDKSLPNILSEDPFYKETLPKLLGDGFRPSGNLRRATMGRPENLHLFSSYVDPRAFVKMCSVTPSKMCFGRFETFAPDMAIKMEKRKVPGTEKTEIWVHLRDNVYWQPLEKEHFPEGFYLASHFLKRHKVTAHAFKFYFDALMNVHFEGSASGRPYFSDVEEFRIVDDLTFVVRWKHYEVKLKDGTVVHKPKYISTQLTGYLSPLACFVYKYFPDGTKIIEDDSDPDTYKNSPLWAQNFAEHWSKDIIVSCGPWIFDGVDDESIRFRRNPDFYNPLAALTEGRQMFFKKSADSIWTDFKAGRTDVQALPSDKTLEFADFLKTEEYLDQSKNGMAIKDLEYYARNFYYLGWNQNNILFKSKKVRRALTYAIDRKRIIAQILNGRGVEVTGTSFIKSSAYDSSIKPWEFDLQKAKKLLEEEGWFDLNGDGILEKEIDGKSVPFKFSITYYVNSSSIKSICEFVSSSLKEVGISCSLKGLDIADVSRILEEKDFDCVFGGWGYRDPPEDLKQLWHSSGADLPGSSNHIAFRNDEVDEIIRKLTYEDDKKERQKLYHRFHAIIHDEAPYTFLFIPKSKYLYREYVQNVFVPEDRRDIIPGADWSEPEPSIFWLEGR